MDMKLLSSKFVSQQLFSISSLLAIGRVLTRGQSNVVFLLAGWDKNLSNETDIQKHIWDYRFCKMLFHSSIILITFLKFYEKHLGISNIRPAFNTTRKSR